MSPRRQRHPEDFQEEAWLEEKLRSRGGAGSGTGHAGKLRLGRPGCCSGHRVGRLASRSAGSCRVGEGRRSCRGRGWTLGSTDLSVATAGERMRWQMCSWSPPAPGMGFGGAGGAVLGDHSCTPSWAGSRHPALHGSVRGFVAAGSHGNLRLTGVYLVQASERALQRGQGPNPSSGLHLSLRLRGQRLKGRGEQNWMLGLKVGLTSVQWMMLSAPGAQPSKIWAHGGSAVPGASPRIHETAVSSHGLRKGQPETRWTGLQSRCQEGAVTVSPPQSKALNKRN